MRFLLRLFGYLSLASGFVAATIDGSRSIANGAPEFVSVGHILLAWRGERVAAFAAALGRDLHPMLEHALVHWLLPLPLALVGLALGFLLLRLGRPARPAIGVLARH